MLTVHLRIADAATKKPLPCRLRITDAAATDYPPLGRVAGFACGVGEDVGGGVRVGKENFAHIDGACEVPLPAGVPLRVRAFHGPEWEPLDTAITLGPGQMAVRLEMTRWFDRHAEGLRSTDTRCHFLSPHAAHLEAAAEDLDELHLLAHAHTFLAQDGNTYPMLPNLTAFSGHTPALDRDGRTVFVNTFNTHPALGKLALLFSHRPIYPLAFGEPAGPDDWSLCDWADQCHRKKGTVAWVDAYANGMGGEALAAAILGKVDAIEVDPSPRTTPLVPWVYKLWSAGILLPLVGASGKQSNRTPVGAMRSYGSPRVGDERAADSRLPGFVSNAPLLRLRAEGSRVVASAESVFPFSKLELVANGKVTATAPATAGVRFSATVEADAPVGWVAARAVGPPSPLVPDMPAFAHTSPVIVGSVTPDPAAVTALRNSLDQTREWIETRGQFADPKRKAQHLARLDAASAKLAVSP